MLLGSNYVQISTLSNPLNHSPDPMETINAAGRKVSLLNDGTSRQDFYAASDACPAPSPSAPSCSAPSSSALSSSAPSPTTSPKAWQSSSYNSQLSGGSDVAPPTSASSRAFNTKRPLHYASSGSTTEDKIPVTGRDCPAKRYLCRFRDSHGCSKTFTTSGHASRHSKIHTTAAKAIQCNFPGCQLNFTRADNMKQHLKTHYKDKSRFVAHKRQPSRRLSSSRSGHVRQSAVDAPMSGLGTLAMAVACQERL